MESLIIDLSPKTENHNENAGNGRKVMRNVYFRIDVEYYTYTFGYSNDSEKIAAAEANVQKYFTEIVEILQSDGWTLKNEDYKREHSGSCPQLMKGNQSLYCHPQNISGEIEVESIPTLEELFKAAKTFNHYKTDNYRDVIVCTSADDAMALYHELYDDKINDIISEATRTKRSNLYRNRCSIVEYIGKKIKVDIKLEGAFFHNSVYTHTKYVGEHLNRLIEEGWIKTAKDCRDYDIVRWVNKSEEKALLKQRA